MATARLNERRVDALKPRKSTYDVRDRDLKGFGVRVMSSGAKRYFIHSQHQGRRVWKIVGDAGSIGTDEARDRAKNGPAGVAIKALHRSSPTPDRRIQLALDPRRARSRSSYSANRAMSFVDGSGEPNRRRRDCGERTGGQER